MRTENNNPSLQLTDNIKIHRKRGAIPPETQLAFHYLGLLHLGSGLHELTDRPQRAIHWLNDDIIISLAETLQLAQRSLQPVHDHIGLRRQASQNSNDQSVGDRVAGLSLKIETIGGNIPPAQEILSQVGQPLLQLDPLLYVAEWLTEHDGIDSSPYIDAAFSVLSELSKEENKGYNRYPGEVSDGYRRVGVLRHNLSGDPNEVFNLAEAWLSSFSAKQDPFGYYREIAAGIIQCGLIDQALALASKLTMPGHIRARDTRNGIYEDIALRFASEGRFDEALTIGELYTKGGRYPLMIAIYGDRAISEAEKGNDPAGDIETVEKILAPDCRQQPSTLVTGHLKVWRARLILGHYRAAETSLQRAWGLALAAAHLQTQVALALDDADYDAAPLFRQALQQKNGAPKTPLGQYQMKTMEQLAKRGYFGVACWFLSSATPSLATTGINFANLAKAEIQQAPQADRLQRLHTRVINVLINRCPILDMAMVDLGLLDNLDGPSRELWQYGIFPSNSILKRLKTGTAIEVLLQANQKIRSGRFDPNDPVHRELQYLQYLEACSGSAIIPSRADFKNLVYRDKTDSYQLSYAEEREAEAAAYEAAQFYWVVAGRVEAKRNVVVLGNNRYGELFIVRPLEYHLQRLSMGDENVKIRYGRVSSSLTIRYSTPNIFDNLSRLANFIETLRQDNTDLFIVDGSATQSPGAPRLPRSMVGYFNWVLAYNEAAGTQTSNVPENHLTELRKSAQFQKMTELIRSQQPTHGFSVSHWTPQTAENISFGNIFNQGYRKPKRTGSEAIFVNPVIDRGRIKNAPLSLDRHTQGYFDDPDRYIGSKKEPVFTTTGIRLVSQNAPLEEVLVCAVQDRMERVMGQMIRLTNPISR